MSFSKEFIEQSIIRMEESKERVLQCINELNSGEIWKRENENSNSIGNLTLHLSGNIKQYINSGLAKTTDNRKRRLEFDKNQSLSIRELDNLFRSTIDDAILVLKNITKKELLNEYNVQGFQLTGIGIVIHVVEHLSYHTGQIAFYTKSLKNKDLGFYKDLDLDIVNP